MVEKFYEQRAKDRLRAMDEAERIMHWHEDSTHGMKTLIPKIFTIKNLVLFLIIFLSPPFLYFIFYMGHSGTLRWIAMLLIASVVSISVIHYIWKESIQVQKLTHNPNLNQCFYGDLTKLASTLKRASNGLFYSQMVIIIRIKDAFLEKLAISRSLSPTDLKEVKRDKEKLMTLIEDQELVDFVLWAEEIDKRWGEYITKRRRKGELFKKRFKKERMLKEEAKYGDINYVEKILEKMEAWR